MITPEIEHEIRGLLSRRQKIEAIKVYRERTGCSLLEAKNTVEAMERDAGFVEAGPPPQRTASAGPGARGETEALLALVADMARTGQKIGAIKIYREHTQTSLAQAKERVEAIARDPSIVPRSGVLAPTSAPAPAQPARPAGNTYVPRERRRFSDEPTSPSSGTDATKHTALLLFAVMLSLSVGAATVLWLMRG